MSDVVCVRLGELIAHYGTCIIGDARRCEALIRDLCGQATRECNLLLLGLREGIPTELLGYSTDVTPAMLTRLARRLEDNFGMAAHPAGWIVGSWAIALGRVSTTVATASSASGSAPARAKPGRRGGGALSRCPTLNTFIGQTAVVRKIAVEVEASRRSNRPLAALLFEGPGGTGKSTLIRLIASELGAAVTPVLGTSIATPSDLLPFVANADHGAIIHIECLDRLSEASQGFLSPMVSDGRMDVVLGEGTSARTIAMRLGRITFIGEVRDASRLSPRLLTSFSMREKLTAYGTHELVEILLSHATESKLSLSTEGAAEIAGRSHGIPRTAIDRLRWARRYAVSVGAVAVSERVARAALDMLADEP